MGGVGSGGKRPRAGRPRKSTAERQLDGNAGHRGRVLPHPSVPPAEPPVVVDDSEDFSVPDDLTLDERQVWLRLAPLAKENGTLTKAHLLAFSLLCQNVVLERRYALSPLDAGGANHRGMKQRLDIQLLRFGLAPNGVEEVAEKQPAVDPMQEKYFGRA